MKKLALVFCMAVFAFTRVSAQEKDDFSNVKLFVSYNDIKQHTNKGIDTTVLKRLYTKTQQLVSQSGVVEYGYSTFLVSPKLEVISNNVDETGVGKVYLAECELAFTVERATIGGIGGAVFKSSEPMAIFGSGSTQKEAVYNAINSLRSNNTKLIAFITSAKQSITEYYKIHCKDVMDQANQALALKNYQLAIALYYSVPVGASCYENARELSVGVYTTYLNDQCERNLTKLKAYVAMAKKDGEKYEEVMAIISNLDPTAKCYYEAVKEIEKIEGRFNEDQKRNWELTKKVVKSATEIEKEKYKALGRISANYQPPASHSTVIVTH